MTALVIAEHDGRTLKPATAQAVTAALALGAGVHVLVAGSECRPVAEQAAGLAGVDKVLLAESPDLARAIAEPLSKLIVALAKDYKAVVAAATSTAKDTLPRVAALLDVMQISDVTAVLGPDSFERPIYAGNAIQTLTSTDSKIVMTVRASKFAVAENGGQAPVETVSVPGLGSRTRFIGESRTPSDRPDLSSARIVVSGGRGLGSADRFQQLVGSLAARLGAAVGASRAAVDAGFASNDIQVGQTGKIVAPDLYIAIGISGAIQHLAGMKEAKVIVAINKDQDAPIFEIADYGLVGDLFELVPNLEQALADRA